MFKNLFNRKKTMPPQHPAPEEDARLAQDALLKSDMVHAFFHISWALASNPLNSTWRNILEAIFSRQKDLEAFVPQDHQMDYARGAALAYLHALNGQYEKAFSLMITVIGAIRDLRYFPWIAEWIAARNALSDVPLNVLLRQLALIASLLPNGILEEKTQQCVEDILPTIDAFRKFHANDPMLEATQASLTRKAGQFEAALVLAEEAYHLAPGRFSAGILATCYRALGETEQTLDMLRAGLRYEPNDLSVLLDIGDLLVDSGRIEEGMAVYKQVLDREPNHPWAKPHYLYCQALLNSKKVPQFQEYMKRHPTDEGVRSIMHSKTPYFGYFPEPTEAIINILRKLSREISEKASRNTSKGTPPTQNNSSTNHLNIELSALESPSAVLALNLFSLKSIGVPAQVKIAKVQTPDPRLPNGHVDFVLWRYNGNNPSPAVPEPSPEIAEKIARLASQRPNLVRWEQEARALASTLQVDALSHLLGVMVHPPECPPKIDIWNWIHNLQMVSAFTIAYLNISEPWFGSQRKRALFSLARGPLDWSVEVALVALARSTFNHPESHADISELLNAILDNIPDSGAIPYAEALTCCGRLLSHIPAELQARLETIAEVYR